MPYDRDALRVLAEKVRAATGPDRDLDLAAYCAATGEVWEWVKPHPSLNAEKLWAKPAGDRTEWAPGVPVTIYAGPTAAAEPFGGMRNVPAYTASLDAAQALVRRILPNWKLGTADADPTRTGLNCWAWAKVEPFLGNDAGWKIGAHEGFGATVPLAILAALLAQAEAEAEAGGQS